MLVSLLLTLVGAAMLATACVFSPALLLFGGGCMLLLIGMLRDEKQDKGGNE